MLAPTAWPAGRRRFIGCRRWVWRSGRWSMRVMPWWRTPPRRRLPGLPFRGRVDLLGAISPLGGGDEPGLPDALSRSARVNGTASLLLRRRRGDARSAGDDIGPQPRMPLGGVVGRDPAHHGLNAIRDVGEVELQRYHRPGARRRRTAHPGGECPAGVPSWPVDAPRPGGTTTASEKCDSNRTRGSRSEQAALRGAQ